MKTYIHSFNKELRQQNQPKVANNKFTRRLIQPKTPEAAYLLGFLWADGYISSTQNRITIEILSTDFLDIGFDKILPEFGNWNVYLRNRPNRQAQHFATLTNNTYLHDFLIDNDYTSKNSSPDKILSRIPKNLHQFWFRGLSDGDGCFYNGPVRLPVEQRYISQYCIGSTYEQDWSYMTKKFDKLNITKYSIKQGISKLGHKNSIIRITNVKDIVKFGQFIYGSTLGPNLGRKYTKYLDIQTRASI